MTDTAPLASPPLAKAALYFYPKSIWSAVALLCVEEKGYGKDELDRKVVDINLGESYTASYLRLNPKGTVPCLVVPLEKTLASGIENRYKALTESTQIVEFLDKMRTTVSKTHTTSSAPAPTLSPATIALSNTNNTIVNLLHSPDLAPMFFLVSARNIQELQARANGNSGMIVKSRYAAALREIKDAGSDANPKFKELWEMRVARFKPYVDLFEHASKDESELTEQQKTARSEHFGKSDALWGAEIKRLLATLEKEIVGPLCLGDQMSLADLHLTAYITRLVTIAGGTGDKDGINAIAAYAHANSEGVAGAQWEMGPKIKLFWETIIERPSWKTLYGKEIF